MTQKTQIDSSTCCWPHEQKVASFSWIQNHPIFQSLTWHVTIKFYLYTWIFEPPKHEKTDSQRVSLRKCQDSATQQTQDAAWQMFALAWATWSRSLYAWWVNGSSSSRIGSSAIQKTHSSLLVTALLCDPNVFVHQPLQCCRTWTCKFFGESYPKTFTSPLPLAQLVIRCLINMIIDHAVSWSSTQYPGYQHPLAPNIPQPWRVVNLIEDPWKRWFPKVPKDHLRWFLVFHCQVPSFPNPCPSQLASA